jgi:hypothetical protein
MIRSPSGLFEPSFTGIRSLSGLFDPLFAVPRLLVGLPRCKYPSWYAFTYETKSFLTFRRVVPSMFASTVPPNNQTHLASKKSLSCGIEMSDKKRRALDGDVIASVRYPNIALSHPHILSSPSRVADLMREYVALSHIVSTISYTKPVFGGDIHEPYRPLHRNDIEAFDFPRVRERNPERRLQGAGQGKRVI